MRAALLLVACVVAACGGDKMGQSSVTQLMKQDVKAGTGAEATAGRRVAVHYNGCLYGERNSDHKGKQFDSSGGGQPFSVRLARGAVLPGGGHVTAGMNIRCHRTLN